LLVLAALALTALCLPAAAAGSPAQVIRDCVDDGALSRTYSNSDLRKARDNLPSDLDEYSDCREVISAAIKRGPGPGSSGGNGGGNPGGGGNQANAATDADFLNSADEQAARAKDQADLEALTGSGQDPPEVDVGGQTIKPGDNGLFDLASASNELPTPLLLALIALGLAALAGVVLAVRSRAPALARAPLLSKIRMPRVGRFGR
jgi:hypothetical protein